MKKGYVSLVVIIAIFLVSHVMRDRLTNSKKDIQGEANQVRIVAMAPSSCEVLYAVGLGGQVVGVSRFTTYPPAAVEKPKIGGYLDVDLEGLVRLKPTAVVLLKEQMTWQSS